MWLTIAGCGMIKIWETGVRARGAKREGFRSRLYQLCAIVNHFLENLVTRGILRLGVSRSIRLGI